MSARDVLAKRHCTAAIDRPSCKTMCGSCLKDADKDIAALSAAGFMIMPRDGMKVPHDAAAAFWRRFRELYYAETGARGFYESFGGGWNALAAALSAGAEQ